MQKRSIEDRVLEQEKKLAAMMQKLQQQKDVLKQLKVKEENQARKHRNHMLIVCGAELASLYGVSFLEEDEIHKVVNFLREKKTSGVFNVEREANLDLKQEQRSIIEEEKEKEVVDTMFDDSFLF